MAGTRASLRVDGRHNDLERGGYKYCQLGEGNAFLRVPPGSHLWPVLTGWVAEFATLAELDGAGRVTYGDGAARFAGATHDPTSHALRAPAAGDLEQELRRRGVYADHRGDTLRLGPAPYLPDRQLLDAVGRLGECVG